MQTSTVYLFIALKHVKALLKYRLLDSISSGSDSVGLAEGRGGPQEFVVLSNSQEMLIILLRGPYLENHCYRLATMELKITQKSNKSYTRLYREN